MITPNDTLLDALYAALDYDAEANELVWLQATKRMAVGDPAGTLNRAGRLVVGFRGKKYPAGTLAWFIHSGGAEWPEYPVRFRNGNALDLREENLALLPTVYSKSQKAKQMRLYRARIKDRQAKPVKRREQSAMGNVQMGLLDDRWHAYDPRTSRHKLGSFETREEAEACAIGFAEALAFLARNPTPQPYVETPDIRAGTGEQVLTLAAARDTFAYDKDLGRVYHRWGLREGYSAVQYNDRNRPFVRASGRQYPAGMLAWFMHHGIWPKRKQIAYHDHDPKNIKLENLYLKGATE